MGNLADGLAALLPKVDGNPAAMVHENHPAPGAKSCWGAMLHALSAPVETVPGQEIRIAGSHDRHSLTIWAEGA